MSEHKKKKSDREIAVAAELDKVYFFFGKMVQVVNYKSEIHKNGAIACLQASYIQGMCEEPKLQAYQNDVNDLVQRLDKYRVKVAIQKSTIIGIVVYVLGDTDNAINSNPECCFIHECTTLPILSSCSRHMCLVRLLDAVREEARETQRTLLETNLFCLFQEITNSMILYGFGIVEREEKFNGLDMPWQTLTLEV